MARRVSSLILAVLLVGTAGIGLLIAAPGFAGLHSITVAGGSMEPTIPLGSMALTRTIDIDEVGVGDIVVFVPPGGRVPVMHRVVRAKRKGDVLTVRTKGDANKSVDHDTIKMKGTGEKVVGHVPYVGYLSHWIDEAPLAALGIPLMFLLLAHPVVGLIRRGRPATSET